LTARGDTCETRRDLANDKASEARARWVVVVPLADAPLFDYLTKSFASIPDVSVVLERRRGRPVSEPAANDRGAEDRRAQAQPVSNFGCAVIRRQTPVAAETAALPGRTLLWPNLRITDVLAWREERSLQGAQTPPANGRKS
jgi:hypothetical protein